MKLAVICEKMDRNRTSSSGDYTSKSKNHRNFPTFVNFSHKSKFRPQGTNNCDLKGATFHPETVYDAVSF